MQNIFYTYETINKPWGGANTFLNYLYQNIKEEKEINLLPISKFKETKTGLFFLNQLGTGPKNNSRILTKTDLNFFIKSNNKLIVRAVNLHCNYRIKCRIPFLTEEWNRDRLTIFLVNNADYVIFQSNYQLKFFQKFGYKGNAYSVINNGSNISKYFDQELQNTDFNKNIGSKNLNLISTSFATKKIKRFDLIAMISKIKNVKIDHFGNWPKNIDPCKVNIQKPIPHKQLIFKILKSDYLLHPAEKDICPNSVIEALSLGIPVIYLDNGSSAEIVKSNGLRLNLRNLKDTINVAFEKKQSIKSNLKQNKYNYSIENATLKYLKVFKKYI